MSEAGDFPPGSAASTTNDRLREKRRDATEALLAEALRFVKWDGDINDLVKDMLSTVATEIRRNPTVLVATVPPGATSGLDVSAEAKLALPNPFRDVIDFIKQIGELAKDEKNFFLKLIFLALCDNACECMCKCICNEQK